MCSSPVSEGPPRDDDPDRQAELATDLRLWFEGRSREMLEMLIRLVEAESPTHDLDAQAAPQAILRDALSAIGYEVRILGGPHAHDAGRLLARLPRERRAPVYQLVVGHSDTVWERGTLDHMPIEIRNRQIYGPGTYDMKAGLVQMVFALRALEELALEPAVAPVAYVTSDEETGSPLSAAHTARLARHADRALILEPAYGPTGLIKTGRKGAGTYEVVVGGRAAHAGLAPETGASAIVAAAGLVQRLHELNDPERGDTVVVGRIHGGTRTNVVPAECRFSVDFRAATTQRLERLAAAIEALDTDIEGTTIAFEGGIERGPMEPTADNRRLWQVVRRAGVSMGLELGEVFVGGGSDGNITSRYAPTVDGLGPLGDGAHARDERVLLDSLPERATLLALVLLAPPVRE